jgi:hypothetical protein
MEYVQQHLARQQGQLPRPLQHEKTKIQDMAGISVSAKHQHRLLYRAANYWHAELPAHSPGV